MTTHEQHHIGQLVVNRGLTVLITDLFDEVKNGLPGFDGVQMNEGRFGSRWAYSEDTTRILAEAGSGEAIVFARDAVRWIDEHRDNCYEPDYTLELISHAYPDALDVLDR